MTCCWHVTVSAPDGVTLLSHTRCEDWKEAQCVATIARGESLATVIWIRPPAGDVFSWD